MGNNNLFLKLFIASIIYIPIPVMIIQYFEFTESVQVFILLSVPLFIFVSAFFDQVLSFDYDMYSYFDSIYKKKYNKKLKLSDNDKLIFRQICRCVYHKTYSQITLNILLDKNDAKVSQFIIENKWEIDNDNAFRNLLEVLSNYIKRKKLIISCDKNIEKKRIDNNYFFRMIFELISILFFAYVYIVLLYKYVLFMSPDHNLLEFIFSAIGIICLPIVLIIQFGSFVDGIKNNWLHRV